MGITAFPFSAVIDVPTARILGRDDAGTGSVEALTNTEIFAILGTGTPSASTYLRGDGTWATVSAGVSSLNGLTDATQTFAVGTTGTDVNFVSAAGVHTLNIPDASATARGVINTGTQTIAGAKTLTTAPKVALQSASTSTLGSSSPSNSQWMFLVNTTNVVNRPVGIVFGGYDGFFHLALQSVMTSSGGNTYGKVSFVGQGGAEYFRVATQADLPTTAFGVTVADAMHFGAFGATNLTADCAVTRWAANHVTFRRGTNAQTVSVANTYTSDTSFERLSLSWASNVCYIGTEKGSAGGTARDLTLGTDGVVRAVFPAATTSGAFYLGPRADSTTTGGNARGDGAVDLQTSRTAANQVASGAAAFVAGRNNTASQTCSVAIGDGNSVTAGSGAAAIGGGNAVAFAYGFATGFYANSSNGERVHAADAFNSRGGQQIVDTVLRVRTTGTTAGSMTFRVRSGYLQTYMAQISGAKSDGTAVAVYFRKIIVKNVGGTLTLVNSEVIGTDYEDNAATTLTVDTSGTNLRFQVTGILGETWTWCTVLYGMDNQW